MKKMILIMFLLMVTLAKADYTCINDTHSQFTTTLTISGNSIPISYPEYCPNNCTNATGECNVTDPMSATFTGIALLIVAGLFIVAAMKTSAGIIFRGLNIEFMQPLFFTFAFMMILVAFTVMISGSQSSTAIYGMLTSGYNTTMWVFIFFISFLVLSFIINILQNRLNQATGGRRK